MADRPFTRDATRCFGPGVADMKGGLAVAAHAARLLADGPRPFRLVELVSVPDEESRPAAFETLDRLAGYDAVLVLEPGEWSEFVQVSFEMLPLGLMAIGGEVRFYLRSVEPELELYASPVDIDPEEPVAPVSEPVEDSAELAAAGDSTPRRNLIQPQPGSSPRAASHEGRASGRASGSTATFSSTVGL